MEIFNLHFAKGKGELVTTGVNYRRVEYGNCSSTVVKDEQGVEM